MKFDIAVGPAIQFWQYIFYRTQPCLVGRYVDISLHSAVNANCYDLLNLRNHLE